jgi:DNA-binding XRE family transcriptional regulator
MTGADWAEWRRRLNYTQETICLELGVRSRQTIISWEKANSVPRMAELALYALEHVPSARNIARDRAIAIKRRLPLRGLDADLPISAALPQRDKAVERLRLRRRQP